MNKDAESKDVFKFLFARLFVKGVRPNPRLPLAHKAIPAKDALSRYNITRFAFKTFIFSAESKSLSIDNAVLGPIPKRLLFTMVKNADYLGSVRTNPLQFRYYHLSYIARNVNGKKIHPEGLSLNMGHEKPPSWDTEHF